MQQRDDVPHALNVQSVKQEPENEIVPKDLVPVEADWIYALTLQRIAQKQ